jgi:hypothetical protein
MATFSQKVSQKVRHSVAVLHLLNICSTWNNSRESKGVFKHSQGGILPQVEITDRTTGTLEHRTEGGKPLPIVPRSLQTVAHDLAKKTIENRFMPWGAERRQLQRLALLEVFRV